MALLRTCDRDGCRATAPNEYGYERETEIPDGWWVLTRGDAGEDEERQLGLLLARMRYGVDDGGD